MVFWVGYLEKSRASVTTEALFILDKNASHATRTRSFVDQQNLRPSLIRLRDLVGLLAVEP